MESLRELYVDDGAIIYFDNQTGCDSTDLDHHLQQVRHFVATVTIVKLSTEGLQVFHTQDAACVIAKVRYRHQPQPGVRSTFFSNAISKTAKFDIFIFRRTSMN
ncbi:hypothetical protein [Acaryochloris marina]|uniref:Uncharacterized protein n=1 Tax=Acaryochloris marina (strain MBIC 11017) TaxID=329726 RepID=B0CBH4_ACAM1|nr:hypothetical protein [Acaryochloris marina]ABW27959.1 hypothetical protein AM1_2963 [Acaryochloris marina MBIC11017]